MHSSFVIERFRQRLVELGYPESRLRRDTQELADHHDDLRSAAKEEGVLEVDAEARADRLLGEPAILAEQAAAALRESSWWGRHPFVSFCILPPFAFVGILIVALILGIPVVGLFSGYKPADLPTSYGLLLMMVTYYAAITVTAILFCWLAGRSASGLKWALVACASCALHNAFLFLEITSKTASVGYSYPKHSQNVITVSIPLLVGAVVLLRQRRRERCAQIKQML